jgi:hypothetical protein
MIEDADEGYKKKSYKYANDEESKYNAHVHEKVAQKHKSND